MELLSGISRYISVPLAAAGVSALVLRESFRRVEHVLLALSSVFVAYIVSGMLAHPDWGAAAQGPGRAEPAAQPRGAAGRRGHGRHDAGAVGARLHPVLRRRQAARGRGPALRARRRHRRRRADRGDRLLRRRRLRRDAARRRASRSTTRATRRARSSRWPATLAATLFGLGFLGAALLAAAIVPLSTAYSISEALGRKADLDDSFDRGARLLPQLRRRDRRRGGNRADPGRAADPDPLPLPGAERRPAAGPAALHALARQGPRADGRARARPRWIAG